MVSLKTTRKSATFDNYQNVTAELCSFNILNIYRVKWYAARESNPEPTD